jgi:hypothetical protein
MKPWHVLAAALLGSSLAMPGGVLGHTAEPKHGGVVSEASDLTFELVVDGDTATIYVEDHGKPVTTDAVVSGTLTVLHGREKSTVAIKPAGDNTLEAKGVKAGKGARVVAVLNTILQTTITVRFIVK